jgi:hypothetical protein
MCFSAPGSAADGIAIWYHVLAPQQYRQERDSDCMTDQLRDYEAGRRQELIESMQGELEIALTFAKVSSIAFGKGKLQRAIDARSRAEAVHTRAIAELVESSSPDPDASYTVRCKLAEVRHALAHLPSSGEPLRRARSAG